MSDQRFPEQTYQPFGQNLDESQQQFAESDSYRFVRTGVYLLLAGYSMLIPSVVFTIFAGRGAIKPDPVVTGLFVAGLFVGVGMLGIGSLFLLASPKTNEKQMARKFIIAQGIAVAIGISQRFFPAAGTMEIVQRIASGYGTYFMISFFQILAINRGSHRLLKIAQRLNHGFIVLIVVAVGSGVLAGALGVKSILFLFLIVCGFFLLLWFQTLWVAISITKVSHQREFEIIDENGEDEDIDEWEDE